MYETIMIAHDEEQRAQEELKWLNVDFCGLEYSLLITRLYNIVKDTKQVVQIVDAIYNTCRHCWDANRGCQCWNDD